MKELEKNELMQVDGGALQSNYIAGLGPAIPPSGGAAALGFIDGFFSSLFKKLFY